MAPRQMQQTESLIARSGLNHQLIPSNKKQKPSQMTKNNLKTETDKSLILKIRKTLMVLNISAVTITFCIVNKCCFLFVLAVLLLHNITHLCQNQEQGSQT